MAAPTTRTRQPSAFHPTVKCTILVHGSADATISAASLASLFQNQYSDAYAIRAVSRSRNAGGNDKVPSLSVYIAPKGYEFPTSATSSGLPRDAVADVMTFLRAQASAMGLDPSDRDALMKVAAGLAAKAKK